MPPTTVDGPCSIPLCSAVDLVTSLGASSSGLRGICGLFALGAAAHLGVFAWLLRSAPMIARGALHSRAPVLAAAAALGLGDAMCNTQTATLLGVLFAGPGIEAAFAAWKCFQAASCAGMYFLDPMLGSRLRPPALALGSLVLLAGAGLGAAARMQRVEGGAAAAGRDHRQVATTGAGLHV